METIAVYWEERIKTYGFSVVRGLSLVRLQFSDEHSGRVGRGLCNLEESRTPVLLAVGHLDGDRMGLDLLVETGGLDQLADGLREILSSAGEVPAGISSQVGMITFQGPHYGDRYGIADAAFGALADRGISIMTAGCSGSSVYIVVHESCLEEAHEILNQTFASQSS